MGEIKNKFITPKEIYNTLNIGDIVYQKFDEKFGAIFRKIEIIEKEQRFHTEILPVCGSIITRVRKIVFMSENGRRTVAISHTISDNTASKNNEWENYLLYRKEPIEKQQKKEYIEYLDREFMYNKITFENYQKGISSII